MKTCSKCGATKLETEFSKTTKARDGLSCRCRACAKISSDRYLSDPIDREKHNASGAKWTAANPEKVSAYQSKYGFDNNGKVKFRSAKWYAENKEKSKTSHAKWQAANKDKVKTYAVKWDIENPGRKKDRNAKYRADNQNKERARGAAYRAANPDKVKAYQVAYAAANPESMRIRKHTRRARERESGGTLSRGLSAKLVVLQKGKCTCGCNQPLGTDYHLDHIMPLALGGDNTDSNIQLLRAKCNLQKSKKHPVDFMQQKGFLL